MRVIGAISRRQRLMKLAAMKKKNDKLRTELEKSGKKYLKVALVSSEKDMYTTTDNLLLKEAFLKRGISAKMVSWQDNDVDYKDFDGALVTTMWGYQNNLKDLQDWMKDVAKSNTPIFNSLEILKANYDKVKQFKILDKCKISHIETMVVKKWDDETEEKAVKKFGFPFVVKPSISGSGEGAVLINEESELDVAREKLTKISPEKSLLVQPFVPEISDGELAIILIDGKIVNVVRRFPGIFQGKFHVEVEDPEMLDDRALKIVKQVRMIPEYEDALYVRIDLVETGGFYKVMELEYFEPQLFYYLLNGEGREAMLSAMVNGVKKRITGGK